MINAGGTLRPADKPSTRTGTTTGGQTDVPHAVGVDGAGG